MTFQTTMAIAGDVTTVQLTGELDATSAPVFRDILERAAQGSVARLVLDVTELTYMSSAGLRGLVFAKQRMGPGVEIFVVGARDVVSETIHLTGLDRTVTMRDAYVE